MTKVNREDYLQLEFEIRFFERLVRDKADFIDALFPLAAAYTRGGYYDKGLEIDKRLAALLPGDPIVHYNLACSLALTGRATDAVYSLRRAVRLGYDDFRHMQNDPDLKTLKSRPDFLELLAESCIGKVARS